MCWESSIEQGNKVLVLIELKQIIYNLQIIIKYLRKNTAKKKKKRDRSSLIRWYLRRNGGEIKETNLADIWGMSPVAAGAWRARGTYMHLRNSKKSVCGEPSANNRNALWGRECVPRTGEKVYKHSGADQISEIFRGSVCCACQDIPFRA